MSRDQLTECPSPAELLALTKGGPNLHSLIAWCMYASGVKELDGRFYTRWQRGDHLILLAQKLVDLYNGKIRRLAISMPPRHGKSRMVSQLGPAWWLGQDPRARVVVCSYSEAIARKSTRICRDVLAKCGAEAFGLTVNERAAATEWQLYDAADRKTRPGGGMRGVGRGGSITGDDVDLAVVDDLYKDHREASNPAIRASAIEFWEFVIYQRLEPWTKAIAMFTRWHHEDVIGWLQAKQEAGELAVPWEFLNLPAVCDTEDDALGREIGDPLWEERFGRTYYDELQADARPEVWASLYQGRPTPAEGGLFKRDWLTYFVEDETGLQTAAGHSQKANLAIFATLDLAFSTKTSADYTALCVWGADLQQGVLYLLHLERERVGVDMLAHWIRQHFQAWGVRRGFVERSGFYADITRALVMNHNLPLREIQPNTDKVSRAQPAAALMASGGMAFRAGAPWLGELERELLAFPGSVNDDQVDAVSSGVHVFHRLGVQPQEGPSGGYAERNDGATWRIGR